MLGVDIQIDEVMEADETILVSRAKGKKYLTNYIKESLSVA